MLPLFAAVVLVSQAWGAYTLCTGEQAGYCKFADCSAISIDPGQSWSKSTCQEAYDNCIANGYFYTDAACTTWGNVGNNPNFSSGTKIWCKWATSCEAIKSETEKTNCITNGSVYKDVPDTGVGAGKACEGGTWTNEGKDPNAVALGCCNWEGDNCRKVYLATEWDACSAGNKYSTCTAPEDGSAGICSNPIGGGGSDPIISYNSAPITGLNVVHFARSLQIASGKDATVFLFDMRGKQIFSQKVLSGTTTISLQKQRQGVYYAVVKSGSQKQTVKVVLK